MKWLQGILRLTGRTLTETEATKDKHKEIAFDLDSCANTVRRECNGSVKFNMLEKVNIFMSAEDGDTIINKLASMQGGLFFRDRKVISW